MSKPYMQTFTAEQLLSLDYSHEKGGKKDNRCPDCLAGISDLGPGYHREKPTPCAFKVKMEIARRITRFDELVDIMETVQKSRKWGWW